MKFFKKIPAWIYLFILIIPTFYSLIRPGFFPMQDDLQAFRTQQMDKCIQDLQIPCRWVPDAGYQYGYPQFIYYPPSVYYVGEAFHLLGFQFIDAVKILFVLGFILSAFTMYLLLQSFLSRWAALIGGLLYAYAPYKAVEVYVRGAMSEFFSLVLFPFVFWSSYQLIKQKKKRYFIFFSLSVGLLLTTHNLMSMIFFPVAGVWILVHLYLEKKWKLVPLVFLSGLLGIGLAAFFTLPVLFERSFVHTESLLGGYFDYRQHFVDIYQMFLSNYWGYGSSVLGPNDDLSLSTGPIHWVVALFAVVLSAVFYKRHKKVSMLVFVLAIVELLILFMMHQKSSFIWSRIPVLAWLQFPWRFMAVSIFLLSLLSAIGVNQITKKQYQYFFGIFVVAAVMFLHLSFFQPLKWISLTDQEKFSGKLWEKELTISIFDYLPIYAKLPPITKAPDKPEVMDGKATISEYTKHSDYQTGKVIVDGSANLRLPLFDFPGMKVFVDGKEIPHNHNDCRNEPFCLGLISVTLNQGEHHLEAKLTKTPDRLLGDVISLMSLGIILGLWWFKKGERLKIND